jgi:endogenous inhibitor of DNA gyrase (YacG/DUF329 family)
VTKGNGGMQAPSMLRTTCAQCPRSLNRSRPWQRFCSERCRIQWHAEERRQALTAYRSDQRNGGRHERGHVPVAAHADGSP